MSPAITRSTDHKYTYQGVTYPGVTSILKVMSKGGLETWKLNMVADAAIEHRSDISKMLKTAGAKGVRDFLVATAGEASAPARQLGTDVHAWVEQYHQTGQIPLVTPGTEEHIKHYTEWWSISGWKLRLSEAYLIAPGVSGYGGTLDLLCYDRDGRTVLADIKTGRSGVFREASLQLAAYAGADFIQPANDTNVYPMPKVERYVILHVTEGGVREIEVPVDSLTYEAWYACIALHKWTQETKGRLT